LNLFKDISLKNYNTWLVGGHAEYFIQPQNIEELKEVTLFAEKNKMPITILGHGSNVLISESGVKGIVLCTRKLTQIKTEETKEKLILEVESGVLKSELLKIFLRYKLAPALFLAGIPGNVGGGIAMNAGVAEKFKPKEFVEIIDWVDVLHLDGKIQRFQRKDLKWSYRHCSGWQPGIIFRAGISWENCPDDSILVQVREANQIRLSKQPLDLPSCGSVFVNPANAKAAQLIDSCGLKGYTLGGAQVSMKHANFIVNTGKASAEEIDQVIRHVQNTVLKKTSIQLHTEVVRMGDWNT